MDIFLECVAFIAGLVFGSFLNVCISRIPRDESIIRPPSHCPRCGRPIRGFDNIPLLSWTLLRGRCRACGERISLRYPAVELLTAIVFFACYVAYGPALLTLKFCVFSFLLIGLIFMDAETGLLPREFTYPGIALGLAFAWIAPSDISGARFLFLVFRRSMPGTHALSLIDSALGATVGAGFFYLAWALYYLGRKRHGLGFGDIALMAMSGAFLGLKLILLVIFFAPIAGVLYVVTALIVEKLREASRGHTPVSSTSSDAGREELPTSDGQQPEPSDPPPFLQREIPFGIFLGGCSLAAIFFGEAIWTWYLGRF